MFEFIPNFGQIVFLLSSYFSIKFIYDYYKNSKKSAKPELKVKDWKKDVVYLVQFPRNSYTVQPSPFCLRVETFLRVHKIKYEVIESILARSTKGKVPFIELNGEQYADSQFILATLTKHFSIKENLTEEQKAIARMMDQMIEGSLFNAAHFIKFNTDLHAFGGVFLERVPMANLLKYIFVMFVGPQILNRFWIKGIARHSKQELNEILRHDFIAIETILGDKKFIFGDKVHEIDCTIFGHMASFTYLPYDHEAKRILREEFPTIKNHMDRMAKMFFSEFQFRE